MSTRSITVYERTSSYCVQCVAVKRALDEKGFDYDLKSLEDQSDEWIQEHKDAGRMSAPIVIIEYTSGGSIEFAGNRVDLIDTLEDK